MSCGRIRKEIKSGWTQLIDHELKYLKVGVLKLAKGHDHTFETKEFEYACVLVSGECEVSLESGENGTLGPRRNPFEDKPYGIFVSKNEIVTFRAQCETAEHLSFARFLKQIRMIHWVFYMKPELF